MGMGCVESHFVSFLCCHDVACIPSRHRPPLPSFVTLNRLRLSILKPTSTLDLRSTGVWDIVGGLQSSGVLVRSKDESVSPCARGRGSGLSRSRWSWPLSRSRSQSQCSRQTNPLAAQRQPIDLAGGIDPCSMCFTNRCRQLGE